MGRSIFRRILFNYKYKNGESLNEVQDREIQALNKVLNNYPNKKTLIVGHTTAFAALFSKWCDINIGDYIYSSDNKLTKVIDIPFDNITDIYELTLKDGKRLYAQAKSVDKLPTTSHNHNKIFLQIPSEKHEQNQIENYLLCPASLHSSRHFYSPHVHKPYKYRLLPYTVKFAASILYIYSQRLTV